jgi:Ca2+-binding EF-hand superfamily protein
MNSLIELRIVLDQMGLDPSEEELQDMIREVDEDHSGSISFVEFVGRFNSIVLRFVFDEHQSLDLIKKAVDTNKSSREELFRAFQVFGSYGRLTPIDIYRMLKYE